MRHLPAATPLFAQRQTLMHPETMLLVDDRQPQSREAHALLHQRVRADDHRGTRCDPLQRRLARTPLHLAGQPGDLEPQRLEPGAQVEQMLLGQQFGGRHQRHLVAGRDRDQGSPRRDNGLAAADIALYQSQHRHRCGQIARDLGAYATLRGCQRECQPVLEGGVQSAVAAEHRRRLRAHALAQTTQADVVGQQFLEGQPPLCRMCSGSQRVEVGVDGRTVHLEQRRAQRNQPQRRTQLGRNQLQLGISGQPLQRAGNRACEASRTDRFGGRIHRSQVLVQRRHRHGVEPAVLRMHDLGTVRAVTHLAVAAQALTGRELLGLSAAEVDETQEQGGAGTVVQCHPQLRAEAESALDRLHRALHLHALSCLQPGNRSDAGAILVTQRQVEPQILHALQPALRQRGSQCRTDAAQGCQRLLRRRTGGGCDGRSGAHARGNLSPAPARPRSRPPRRAAAPRHRLSPAPDTAARSTPPSPR